MPLAFRNTTTQKIIVCQLAPRKSSAFSTNSAQPADAALSTARTISTFCKGICRPNVVKEVSSTDTTTSFVLKASSTSTRGGATTARIQQHTKNMNVGKCQRSPHHGKTVCSDRTNAELYYKASAGGSHRRTFQPVIRHQPSTRLHLCNARRFSLSSLRRCFHSQNRVL